MDKKYIWIVSLLIATFIYGVCVGVYQIFPFRYIKDGKDLLDQTFSSESVSEEQFSSSIQTTFLQRLLIKKVKIGDGIGSGGGMSSSGSLLFLITNKGHINVYNVEKIENLNVDIEDVPLNLAELKSTGIFTDRDIELSSFRVNGVYSEQIDSSIYRLFVSHHGIDAIENCITHNISSTDLKVDGRFIHQTTNWHTIFTAEPCIDPDPEYYLSSHPFEGAVSGGNIVEFDENNLLVTVGTYMRHGLNNTESYSMDSSNPYGKTILIDKSSGEWSIYSIGHRNPAGLFIDRNGTIWSSENGPWAGDELNIIEPDNNYGWPLVSLGVWYNPSYRLQGDDGYGRHSGFVKPVFSWPASIAPANLLRIEGKKFEAWKGDLIIGTRRDQSLRRLRLDDSLRVIYDERIEIGHRVRDLTALPNEMITVFTDDGYLLFIEDGGSSFVEMTQNEIEKMRNLNKFDRFASGSNN